ncbi:MAG: hypothetical protein QM811_18120 [Pirellulales bacterium]
MPISCRHHSATALKPRTAKYHGRQRAYLLADRRILEAADRFD